MEENIVSKFYSSIGRISRYKNEYEVNVLPDRSRLLYDLGVVSTYSSLLAWKLDSIGIKVRDGSDVIEYLNDRLHLLSDSEFELARVLPYWNETIEVSLDYILECNNSSKPKFEELYNLIKDDKYFNEIADLIAKDMKKKNNLIDKLNLF